MFSRLPLSVISDSLLPVTLPEFVFTLSICHVCGYCPNKPYTTVCLSVLNILNLHKGSEKSTCAVGLLINVSNGSHSEGLV